MRLSQGPTCSCDNERHSGHLVVSLLESAAYNMGGGTAAIKSHLRES